MSRAFRAVVLATVLAVAGSGCGPTEEDQLRRRVTALSDQVAEATARERELTERLDQLESAVAPLVAPPEEDEDDAPDPLVELETALAELGDRVEALAAVSASEEDAAAAAQEAAAAAASDVRASLDEVRGSAERAQGEIDELRVLYETLRDRLDAQQQ